MEHRLFEEGTVPEYTTEAWYRDRETAPHLEQGIHQGRLHQAADLVNRVHDANLAYGLTAVDLGCGDGGLLSLLAPTLRAWGYDLQPSNIEASKARNVDVRLGSIFDDDIEWGDIAVVTECLEHLLDPHAFVRKVAEHSRFLVASSPCNETPESHYEFHTWCWDHEGYNDLLTQSGFTNITHWDVDIFHVVIGENMSLQLS
jgi:2-polyprenyl-3-methyl-5-hydroxy-6-metoxy-1,4-benzoquinol methylase